VGHGFVDFVSSLFRLEDLKFHDCEMEAEHLMALILDSHIPHANMICPHLAILSFNNTTLPGDVLVQVLESRAPLPGISWEQRCLRSVEVLSSDLGHDSVALENIVQACEGYLIFRFTPYIPWGPTSPNRWGSDVENWGVGSWVEEGSWAEEGSSEEGS